MYESFQTEPMKMPGYQEAQSAFSSGKISEANRKELERYILAISQNATGDDAIQARDIVQSLTINHLILQRHIDELDRKSKTTQILVILLTIASLAGTVAQAWLAYKADLRSETEMVSRVSIQAPSIPKTVNNAIPTSALSSTALAAPAKSKSTSADSEHR
jgi:hypothetical protein